MTATPEMSGASARMLGMFVRPPARSQAMTWTILSSLVLLVGFLDYITGSVYSLSILYLLPVSLGTLWHGGRVGSVIAVACFLSRAAGDAVTHDGMLPTNVIFNFSGMLVIHLFLVWLIQSLVWLHRQLEGKIEIQSGELRESAEDRRRLEMEILDVAARERSAFGRELHDEIGQHFVATALAAQALAEKLGSREGASDARAIVRWIEDGVAKSRKLARGLLLSRIEPERFPQELEELAIAASRGQVQCRLKQEGREIEVDASRCAQLFRIAQEAIANALRHAQPHAIQIILANDERALSLTIEDDGCGFPEGGQASEGLGIRIMHHRARFIGASLAVRSTSGKGTRIICRLPHSKSLSP
jgi:signal transduction histidine kinase